MSNYDYWSGDLNATEDILEHHGILGQKWGVRRYQYKDGSLTPAGQERYLSNKSYMQTRDVVLGRGNKMYRISTNDNPVDAPRLYTALTKSDADAYKGLYSKDLQRVFKVQKFYQKTYETSENTKIASEKNCKKIMQDLLQNDAKFKNAVINTLNDERKQSTFRFSPKEIEAATREVTSGKLSTSAFNVLSTTIVKDDTHGFQKQYFNALANKGYDGLPDINNKYIQTKYHATAPAIIFNTTKLKLSSIDAYDMRKIQGLYTQELLKQQVRNLAETGGNLINYVSGKTIQEY